MQKILLITEKFDKVAGNLSECLTPKYNVQLCAGELELVEGMMNVVKPDMVILYAAETGNIDSKIFVLFHDRYRFMPVLLVGALEDCEKYREYCVGDQFSRLLRPVRKDALLQKCIELLGGEEEPEQPDHAKDADVKKNILIVDDSALTLRGAKAILENKYEVSLATSGEKAMTMIRKNRPDLILLDYEMPECDGKMTLEMIRSDDDLKDIPVIFLTGVADKSRIAAVLRLNPDGYVLKPLEKKRILKMIEDVFENRK